MPPASQTDTTLEAIAALVAKNERFLIASHYRPDGDAIGSVLAMRSARYLTRGK